MKMYDKDRNQTILPITSTSSQSSSSPSSSIPSTRATNNDTNTTLPSNTTVRKRFQPHQQHDSISLPTFVMDQETNSNNCTSLPIRMEGNTKSENEYKYWNNYNATLFCDIFTMVNFFVLLINVHTHYNMYQLMYESNHMIRYLSLMSTISRNDDPPILPTQEPVNYKDSYNDINENINNSNNSTSPTSTTTIYYSQGRHDRSGAVVHDMLWVHAYAYQQNAIYGGACMYNKTGKYQNVTTKLLKDLNWYPTLQHSCPPYNYNDINNDKTSTTKYVFVPRGFYTNLNASVFTNEWKEYFHKQNQQNNYNNNDISNTNKLDISNDNIDLTITDTNDITSSAIATTRKLSNQLSSNDINDDSDNGTNPKNNVYTIAVHIRRGDVHPCTYSNRYLTNAYYLKLIQSYTNRKQNKNIMDHHEKIVVNIYSESHTYESFDIFRKEPNNYNLKLDDTLSNVWKALSTADVAILSKSSFSYVPAIINPNTVVYTLYRHLPLKSWIIVDPDFSDEAFREATRIKQSICDPNRTYTEILNLK